MSAHASPGAAAAVLLAALILGFGAGAFAGNLSAGPDAAANAPPATATSPSPTPTTPASSINLTAEKASVSPNEQIQMSGTLEPAEAGVDLIVERSLDGGEWGPFPDADDPVTVTTEDDGTFSTWVVTSRTGENRFRLVGEVAGKQLESEPVTVTIS